jgi:hypothetical protein
MHTCSMVQAKLIQVILRIFFNSSGDRAWPRVMVGGGWYVATTG